jgi:hypothetical protein
VFFAGNPRYQLPPFGTFTFYDLVAIVLAALFFGAFLYMTFTQARELNRLESIKPHRPNKKRH